MQYAELKPGDEAPEFELWDATERPVSLSDYQARRLLLFFFRKAGTPGCTRQIAAVAERFADLFDRDIEVAGVSTDYPEAQQAFLARHPLPFPLLSDEDHQAAEHYGAWGLCQGPRKRFLGMIRTSILIGSDGRIEGAWYDLEPENALTGVAAYLAI